MTLPRDNKLGLSEHSQLFAAGTFTLPNGAKYYKDAVMNVVKALSQLVHLQGKDAGAQNALALISRAASEKRVLRHDEIADADMGPHAAAVTRLTASIKGDALVNMHIVRQLLQDNAGHFTLNIDGIKKEAEADAKQMGLELDTEFFPESIRIKRSPGGMG